jgi:excisionase family DNA binding protein
MRRRTEISIETDRVMVISRPKQTLFAPCSKCGAEVPMVPVDTAAAMTGTSSLTIYRMVERRQLHFVETGAGLLLICSNSLSRLEEHLRRAVVTTDDIM